MNRWVLGCLVILALSGCGNRPEPSIRYLETGLSNVAGFDLAEQDNRLHLVAAGYSQTQKAALLLYLQSNDGGDSWQPPQSLPEKVLALFRPRPHNAPQIAVQASTISIAWPASGEGYGGSGHLMLAISDNEGKDWQRGAEPAARASAAEGFADLLVDSSNRLQAVWLDSRNGDQALYQSSSADGGLSWESVNTVDSATCECCWNSLAQDGDKLYLLYRDKNPRDMALALSEDGGTHWQLQSPVGAFNWQFEGCPHAGGGLAASNGRLHAAVWTAQQEAAGLHYLMSANQGKDWSVQHRLGNVEAKYVSLTATPEGGAVAVWSEGQNIKAALFSAEGEAHPARLEIPTPGKPGYPKVATVTGGYRIFWLENQDKKSLLADYLWEVELSP